MGRRSKFQSQRTQPAYDLARRLSKYAPNSIVDLGCGPGNSTAVLKSIFPNAHIIGVDQSESMIQKAKKSHPDIDFRLDDLRRLQGKYDLIFSNACLQWVPDHRTLLPHLMDHLNRGGVLAVQLPMNEKEPLYRLIGETAARLPFDFSKAYFETNDTLTPQEYYEILSAHANRFDLWETVYYHELPSHDEMISWVRGTRLRPYLDCLNQTERRTFEKELLSRIRESYPIMNNGNVILKFRRFFFLAIQE